MPPWHSQGSHRFYCEDDLLYFEVHGPFTLADAQRLYSESESIEQQHGYVLAAFDNRDGPGMTAEARRYVGMKSRQRNVTGASAVIGANLAVRTMSLLVMNVARLAGMKSTPIIFCATPEEAMAWLAVRRQEFRAARK